MSLRSTQKGTAAVKTAAVKTLRCAVYTRKSIEERTEQELTSCQAQREAAQAYIKSQAPEGWICLPEPYGDGGFSGGNIERPSLVPLAQRANR